MILNNQINGKSSRHTFSYKVIRHKEYIQNKLTRERTREKYQREWITNESKKNNNGTIVLQKVKIQEQKKVEEPDSAQVYM